MLDRTTRVGTLALAAAVLAVCAVPAWGDALAAQQKAQAKLMAYRAARADAIRKLAERIQGLAITSKTTVKDFVAESDEIQTSMRAWLSGIKEVGKPKYMEDGTCEVKMRIPIEEVVASLKRWHKEFYKGNKVKIRDLEKIMVTTKVKVFTETGVGARREVEMLVEGGPAVALAGEDVMSLTNLRGKAKAYWLAHVKPQGRLMAVRAARVVAMRRLAERIKGVYITSETTVRDFVAESDDINVSMRAFLRGAREKRIRYHNNELIVEVDVEVTYRSVYANLKSWGEFHFKGDKIKIKKLEKLVVTTKDQILKETGMGIPPERYLRNVGAQSIAVLRTASRVPPWATQSLKVVGAGVVNTENKNAAQAKLMARRAAELDARRKLGERVNGLTITSETTVRDFIAENDRIETTMLAFQQGARVVEGSQKTNKDGTVEVTVEIELKPLWNMIISYQKTLSIKIK